MSSYSYDVFISYRSDDFKHAEELHERLVAHGFRVWFDKARLNPGCNWHAEIEAGCEASRTLLPVLTPRWKESPWTKFEIYGAEAIIPLHFEGEWDEVAILPLMRYQTFDFRNAETADWSKLFESIRGLLAQPEPQKAERIAHLRYRANPYFVGREVELNKINEALHRNPTAALTQGLVQAIAALGGVGKTTLARQYAEKFWRLYPQMFWIDARTNIVSEFARLAELLKPGLTITDESEKAQIALQILNDRTQRLLILDNAEDEESVQEWIPKSGGCHTIITSRFTAWSAAIETCYIYVLEPEPARQLLLKRAGREPTPANNDACDRLAEKLGRLPLALEQAAAYIFNQKLSFDKYLSLYDQATHKLLAKKVLGSTQYPDSVITTWNTTVEKLAPPDLAILRLSAFLAPEPIPIDMFIKGATIVQDLADEFSDPDNHVKSAPSAYDEMDIRDGLENLTRYSMITSHGQDFTVHALVQTVERFDTPDAQKPHWIEQAVEMLTAYGPENAHDYRTWPIWNRLQPHAVQLWERTQADSRVRPNVKLLTGLDHLYFGKGLYAESLPVAQKALELDEQTLGPDHPDIAERLLNLGESFRVMNRLADAEPLVRRAVEINKEHYGPDHQEVAGSLNYLALVLQNMNKIEEAEKLYRQALEIYETVDDPDQFELSKCLNNLAILYLRMGKYSKAEPLFRKALEIRRVTQGERHPDYAFIFNNLGHLHHEMGNYVEAESFYQQTIEIFRVSLDEDHPNYAKSIRNLAVLYYERGNYVKAESLFRQVLEIRRVTLGEDHPDYVDNLGNLALVYHAMGKYSKAEQLQRQALDTNKKSLSPDSPELARLYNNLGFVLLDLERYQEAKELLEKAITIELKSIGPDHPRLANRYTNLARAEQGLGNLALARELLLHTMQIDESTLPEGHHKRLERHFHLGGLTWDEGNADEARRIISDTYQKQIASLGSDHPDTQKSRQWLLDNDPDFQDMNV